MQDGLAADNVYVLDPCCGTGRFITAVLRQIHSNLLQHGLGDTIADQVREASVTRVFGFEIMPAPFVVAHLQVGLTLASLGALLADGERAGVYLTNALTGWEPHTNKPLPFPELEAERDSADAIKQAKPILVILGTHHTTVLRESRLVRKNARYQPNTERSKTSPRHKGGASTRSTWDFSGWRNVE